MGLVDAVDVDVADPQPVGQDLRRDRGMIAMPPLERVGEALLQQRQRLRPRIAGDRRAAMMIKLAHIVQPMAVIGMVMRPHDRIDMDDVGAQQLRPHVGRRIDQDARGRAFDQDGHASPPVLRLVRIAGAPVIADARHPGGCPAAQHGELQAHATLAKRVRKLADVAAASCSTLSPRKLARKRAVSAT